MTSDVLQHDAVSPNLSLIATHYLNQQLPNRWVGRSSGQIWPPRSPDLNPLDYRVWGYIKAMMCARKLNTRDELLRRILSAARCTNNAAVPRKVTRALVTQVGKCIHAVGGHFKRLVPTQLTAVFNKHTTYYFIFYLIQFTVNTHSSPTVSNQTHVYKTFEVENYLWN
jgi:hypothetical protein